MRYDLFIPAAKKDFNKVQYAIKCAIKNLEPKPDNIFVISPVLFCNNLKIENYSIKNITDEEVLRLDRAKISYRPNWIAQQIIKLLQDVTINENYLMLDSDFFLTKRCNLLDGQYLFFLSIDQYHNPYFEFQKKFLGFDKVYRHSFISEIMLFNKNNINDMLASKNMTKQNFVEYCYKNTNKLEYISEQELYGNYIFKNHRNVVFKNIRTIREGRLCEEDQVVWNDKDIESLINFSHENNYDGIGLHSWT